MVAFDDYNLHFKVHVYILSQFGDITNLLCTFFSTLTVTVVQKKFKIEKFY